jgi:hypothetical protein
MVAKVLDLIRTISPQPKLLIKGWRQHTSVASGLQRLWAAAIVQTRMAFARLSLTARSKREFPR